MLTLHYNNTTLNIQPTDDSYRYRSLMGGDTLTLTFDLPRWVDFPLGTWCEWQAARYTLRTPATLRKDGERHLRYTLTMEADASHIGRYKLRNPADNRLKFSLCATPAEYAQLIVDNLNQRDGEGTWTVGTCLEAAEKTVAFDHTYVADAIQQVAEAFDTEWEVKDHTVSLRRVEYYKDNPLPLSYGKGNGFVPGVGRAARSGSQPVEVLYVQGGTRNIDRSRYGSAELLLPKGQTLQYEGRTYLTSADGLSIRRADKEIIYHNEDSLDCSDIYPSRVGEVTEVIQLENGLYDFVDDTIPADLNYEECLMEGETMTVIFQSGMLAGREFEAKYIHADRRFELVQMEEDGLTMPGGSFVPQVGDRYAVFGIMLPDAYICDNATKTGAEWDMFREAARYLYEHEDPRFTFTGELQGLWAKRNWLTVGGKLVVGGHVLFSDPQFAPDGVTIRITGIKDYLNAPHSPELELSNEAAGRTLSSALGKLQADQVLREEGDRRVQQFTRRRFRDTQETIAMLEEALLDGFTDSISPVAVRTMSLVAGDESLQFDFVNPSTLEPTTWNATYDQSAKKFTAPAGTIMHYTLGVTTLSPTHAKKDYLRWTLPAYPSPVLDDPQTGYYLYARVPEKSGAGAFLLSAEAKDLHAEEGWYHLLVGILTSEGADGGRSFVTLYGFTEILPGRITTDKIVSADGQTYFDLAAGEIGGNIKFRSTGSEDLVGIEQGIADAVDGVHVGIRNLIAKQYMLDWNDTDDRITTQGSDDDGEYLAIEQRYLFEKVAGGNEGHNDIFQGKIKYKENTQYAFKVRWKLEGEMDYAGLIFCFYYTDSTKDQVVLAKNEAALNEKKLVTQAGKTLQKISCTYGTNTYRSLIYDIQLTEGNKQPEGYAVAPEDQQAQVDAVRDTVNSLEVGGENLITECGTDTIQLAVGVISIGDPIPSSRTLTQPLTTGQYVFSYEGCKVTGMNTIIAPVCNLYVGDTRVAALSSNTTRYLLDVPEGASVSVKLESQFVSSSPRGTATITRAMLQRGNKPTAYQRAMQYLTDAIKNGSTDILGGLLLTNIMGVKDDGGDLSGGVSGLGDNVAFWSGGSYEEAVAQAQSGEGDLPVLLTKTPDALHSRLGIFRVIKDGIRVDAADGSSKIIISNKSVEELALVQEDKSASGTTLGVDYDRYNYTKQTVPIKGDEVEDGIMQLCEYQFGTIGGKYRLSPTTATLTASVGAGEIIPNQHYSGSAIRVTSNHASWSFGAVYLYVYKDNVLLSKHTVSSTGISVTAGVSEGDNDVQKSASVQLSLPSTLDFGTAGSVRFVIAAQAKAVTMVGTILGQLALGTACCIQSDTTPGQSFYQGTDYATASLSIAALSLSGIDKYSVFARDGIAIILGQNAYFRINNEDGTKLDISMKGLPTSSSGLKSGQLWRNGNNVSIVQ